MVIIAAVIASASLRKTEEPSPQEKKLANVEVITIRAREYRQALTLPAMVKADKTAAISPEFSGTLAKWFVPEGANVEKGQVVAELDSEILLASLGELNASMESQSKSITLARIGKESEAMELKYAQKQTELQELALKSAQADQDLAKIEFERFRKLVKNKVMDSSKLDTVRTAFTQSGLAVARAEEAVNSAQLGVRSAEIRVKEAMANQDLAKASLVELRAAVTSLNVKIEKAKLKAPIPGRIEEYLAEPGEVVAAGMPLAYIYDLRYLRAVVNVPDRYVAFLDPGNPTISSFIQMNMPGAEQRISTKLIVPGLPKLTGGNETGIELDSEIARIAQAADPESNTFQVELRLPNPGGALRDGVIARAKIEYLNYPRAIVIPVKAIQVTDEGPRVLVVEEAEGSELVQVRDIEPITIHGSELLIGKGLNEGDRLIVAGWKGLVAGEAVNVLVEDVRFTTNIAPTDKK